MTQEILNWIWQLGSRDLCALIGVSLIGLSIVVAVMRKIGDWI